MLIETMQIETMTVEEATQKLRALGLKISTTTLREGIAQGQFPFGSYIKTDKSCVCYVWTRLLEKWVAERVFGRGSDEYASLIRDEK